MGFTQSVHGAKQSMQESIQSGHFGRGRNAHLKWERGVSHFHRTLTEPWFETEEIC